MNTMPLIGQCVATGDIMLAARMELTLNPPDRILSCNEDTTVEQYHRNYGLSVRTGNILIKTGLYYERIGTLFDEYELVENHRHAGYSTEWECFEMFYAAGIL